MTNEHPTVRNPQENFPSRAFYFAIGGLLAAITLGTAAACYFFSNAISTALRTEANPNRRPGRTKIP